MPLTPGLYLHSHLWHICRWGYCKPCDWWLCGWRCKRTRSQINSSPFFSFLSIQLSSISKAINSAETPVKEKHARRILKIKQTNRQLLFRSVVCAWLLYNVSYGLKCKILILESLFWGLVVTVFIFTVAVCHCLASVAAQSASISSHHETAFFKRFCCLTYFLFDLKIGMCGRTTAVIIRKCKTIAYRREKLMEWSWTPMSVAFILFTGLHRKTPPVCASWTTEQQESSWGLTGRREPTPSGPTRWASLCTAAPSSAGSSATYCTKSCGTDTAT